MLSCENYDYIEIACMHRFAIKLTLKSGDIVVGTALDTLHNDNKQECVKVLVEKTEQSVVLDEVVKLEAVTANPHFQQISFLD